MIFIVSLCVAVIFVLTCGEILRKKPLPFYAGAVILSIAAVLPYYFDIVYPVWLSKTVLKVISGGALTGAFFVIVMYAGVFPAGSFGAKTFMPVRAQLSIMGSVFAICHGVALGKSYLKNLFSVGPVFSILMVLIMLPLFITSFKAVRKRMNAKKWKSLQRFAYLFYGMIYMHILLIYIPRVKNGVSESRLKLAVYTFIFLSYALLRITREVKKKDAVKMVKWQFGFTALSVLVSLFVLYAIDSNVVEEKNSYPEVAGVARSENSGESDDETHSSYKDGTYYAEAMGMNGKIGVSVTVSEGIISAITIDKFGDDEEYFDPGKDGAEMIDEILSGQSTDVDTVSGATYSSEGLRNAVKAAIEQATDVK